MSDGEDRAAAAASGLERDAFVRRFGALYEGSPWVAEGAWERRPFAGVDELQRALERTVLDAPRDRILALIRGHPELAGSEARAGTLTEDSAHEQASAGLDRLSAGEVAELARLNAAYRERFGFPMVVAVREHTKESILAQAQARLANAPEEEVRVAVREILKIGRLRLRDALAGIDAGSRR